MDESECKKPAADRKGESAPTGRPKSRAFPPPIIDFESAQPGSVHAKTLIKI